MQGKQWLILPICYKNLKLTTRIKIDNLDSPKIKWNIIHFIFTLSLTLCYLQKNSSEIKRKIIQTPILCIFIKYSFYYIWFLSLHVKIEEKKKSNNLLLHGRGKKSSYHPHGKMYKILCGKPQYKNNLKFSHTWIPMVVLNVN